MKRVAYQENLKVKEFEVNLTQVQCMDYTGQWNHDYYEIFYQNNSIAKFFGYPTDSDILKAIKGLTKKTKKR